jgi:hypothetical protein
MAVVLAQVKFYQLRMPAKVTKKAPFSVTLMTLRAASLTD